MKKDDLIKELSNEKEHLERLLHKKSRELQIEIKHHGYTSFWVKILLGWFIGSILYLITCM